MSAEALKAISWPAMALIVLVIFFVIFREPISRLIDRAKSVKVPGGELTTIPYGEAAADAKALERNAPTGREGGQGSTSGAGVDWARTGDLFWLGNDLMWATDVLLRGGSPSEIWLSLVQSLHHARQLGFHEDRVETVLDGATCEATDALSGTGDHWTLERRGTLSSELRDLANRIGATAADRQATFEPWAPGASPHASVSPH